MEGLRDMIPREGAFAPPIGIGSGIAGDAKEPGPKRHTLITIAWESLQSSHKYVLGEIDRVFVTLGIRAQVAEDGIDVEVVKPGKGGDIRSSRFYEPPLVQFVRITLRRSLVVLHVPLSSQ
jgi:hypothetical protein